MMTLMIAAALAAQAPVAPDVHAQHMQMGQSGEHKDCCKDACKDCCKDMDAKDADHAEHHGHPAQ
jgi:hypothetical protein